MDAVFGQSGDSRVARAKVVVDYIVLGFGLVLVTFGLVGMFCGVGIALFVAPSPELNPDFWGPALACSGAFMLIVGSMLFWAYLPLLSRIFQSPE